MNSVRRCNDGFDTSDPAMTEAPAQPPRCQSSTVASHRGGMRSLLAPGLWIAIGVVLAAIPIGGYLELRGRTDAQSARLGELRARWAMLSRQQQAAESGRAGIEALVKRWDGIEAEGAAPRWTAALRSIATAAGTNAELHDVQARGEADAPGQCVLRIEGVCTGASPRTTADRFRQTLEEQLQRHFRAEAVTVRFERLEEEGAALTAPSQRRKASFRIVASIGRSAEP